MGFVLFDLDSTLANTEHRAHLANHGDTSHEGWIAYSKACVGDTVVPGVAAALRLAEAAGHVIVLLSGRNDEARQETISWLDANQLPFDIVRLRRADDIRHNGEYKVAYIKDLQRDGDVIMMYEDHLSVAQMIEEQTGVPVVTVRPWYADTVGVNLNALKPGEQ